MADPLSWAPKQQFQLLVDRANKRFAKLRDLQARSGFSWPLSQAAFHKSFDAFSRLWQFQLANRASVPSRPAATSGEPPQLTGPRAATWYRVPTRPDST
ncbi:hypothetical protein TSOC_013804 [Tetrabaena socialis]|uniref:Uncharacterized protein n=1 Tax=Tetrabaena socialis TaxID=47790 RepID=A0A2J7ZJC7_9CHLO|nr:hypothetical protein TSOC_013804 [Tetrabaena socialis]|eukprot:PNH00375.1 hypothetical protein TSOC_013804 [Tetrabaena socialis]